MFKPKDQTTHVIRSEDDVVLAGLPQPAVQTGIMKLRKAISSVEVDLDANGFVRCVSTVPSKSFGLACNAFAGDPIKHAKTVLAKGTLLGSALQIGTRNVELNQNPTVHELPGGQFRVEFRQMLSITGRKRRLPVRGGFVHVYMTAEGNVYQVISTLRHGSKPRTKRLISRTDAIGIALRLHDVTRGSKVNISCRLTVSAHNGKFDPVYEVLVASRAPQIKVWQYLVQAVTREVVYGVSQLHFADVKARALLRVPASPKVVDADVRDALLKEILPDPTLLRKPDYFDMLIEKDGKWETLKALPDGTFNYPAGSDELGAVSAFIAMYDEDVLAESNSGHKSEHTVPVYVFDRSVADNAYWNPAIKDMHLGVGSGLERGGLYHHIEYDLSVELHENYHKRVGMEATGQDLPGAEGAAIHEACGDYGAILGRYRGMLLYGNLYGETLTRDLIKKDKRVVGILACYPHGIRTLRNRKTINDKIGECHDDGEIVGGAMTDVMEILATDESVTLEQGLSNACAILNVALQHVPAHKVMFRDMLRAFITADGLLFSGQYRAAIEAAYGKHGIKLTVKIDDPDALMAAPPSAA